MLSKYHQLSGVSPFSLLPMASAHPLSIFLLFFLLVIAATNPNPNPNPNLPDPESDDADPFSIMSWHDYSPPSPPPPPPLNPPTAACQEDLGGAGSFDSLCKLSSSVILSDHIYIKGNGTLSILPGVSLACPLAGCLIIANLSGDLRLGRGSAITAGALRLAAANMTLDEDSAVNTTALAGDPPPQTSGVPQGTKGDGGGHGGRGASCVLEEGQTPEDSWGGDVYGWAFVSKPDSYGSRGGTTSREFDYGGGGGGRIWIEVKETLEVEGIISADGGQAEPNGGGGSGGSIYISAYKM